MKDILTSLFEPNNLLIAFVFILCNGVWGWVAKKSNGDINVMEGKMFILINLVLYQGMVLKDPALYGITFAAFIAMEVNSTIKGNLQSTVPKT